MAWAPVSSFAKKRRQERDRWRGSSRERGYTTEWEKARAVFLAEHPLCSGNDSQCERDGIVTPATVVDHIIPHRGDQEKFWNRSNWGAMCTACHGKKTASGR